jgi:hypothetical protein
MSFSNAAGTHPKLLEAATQTTDILERMENLMNRFEKSSNRYTTIFVVLAIAQVCLAAAQIYVVLC